MTTVAAIVLAEYDSLPTCTQQMCFVTETIQSRQLRGI